MSITLVLTETWIRHVRTQKALVEAGVRQSERLRGFLEEISIQRASSRGRCSFWSGKPFEPLGFGEARTSLGMKNMARGRGGSLASHGSGLRHTKAPVNQSLAERARIGDEHVHRAGAFGHPGERARTHPVVFTWLSERTTTLSAPPAPCRVASLQTAEDPVQFSELGAVFIAERFPAPAGPDSATIDGAAENLATAAYGGWSETARAD